MPIWGRGNRVLPPTGLEETSSTLSQSVTSLEDLEEFIAIRSLRECRIITIIHWVADQLGERTCQANLVRMVRAWLCPSGR
jgi:hypothetical protein